jgi:xylulokinase
MSTDSGYLLGIDIGTSGTKAVVIDTAGKIHGLAQRSYGIDSPRPDWAEQDPDVYWQSTVETVREAAAQCGSAGSVEAIGFSGQMHGTVLVTGEGKPLRPAIIWCDRRTTEEVSEICEVVGRERLARLTCNPVAVGFMAASLVWLNKHEPQVLSSAAAVMLPKDYVRLKMTGQVATDASDASSTLLFDTANRRWSREMMDLLGLPASLFPPCAESPEVAGHLTKDSAAALGLPHGIPVAYGGGDQPIQAVGNAVIAPGTASSTIGTGGQFFTPVTEPFYDPRLRTHTFCHAVPGVWNVMGASLCAGMALDWFRRALAPESSFDDLCAEAAEVPAGADGLIFLPYLIGERTPHMDPHAAGVLFGLRPLHTRGHIVRAIMEGVTFALRDSLEIIRSLGINMTEVIASGGGSESSLWMQMQADVFRLPVRRSLATQQAAVGAALVGGVAAGIYDTVSNACAAAVKIEGTPVLPDERTSVAYEKNYEIFRELYPANRRLFARVAG